jgi:hypothetical protein
MALAAARTITPAVNRGQIAIEPAAAGCSAFRDFVHCRFADAGRRRVWLWSPTAGIRKPSHEHASPLPRQHRVSNSITGRNRCIAMNGQPVPTADSCTAANRYSNTSSARPDKGSGTVMPSALAVLRCYGAGGDMSVD